MCCFHFRVREGGYRDKCNRACINNAKLVKRSNNSASSKRSLISFIIFLRRKCDHLYVRNPQLHFSSLRTKHFVSYVQYSKITIILPVPIHRRSSIHSLMLIFISTYHTIYIIYNNISKQPPSHTFFSSTFFGLSQPSTSVPRTQSIIPKAP
jgi:hypothetical protein